jgi:hypothetical protein
VFTSELKFLVDIGTANAVQMLTGPEMEADSHAVELGDAYRTTTLYFDTREFDLYFRRGSNGRAKFRIRRYNAGPNVFLERKAKMSENRLFKRRSTATIDDLVRLGDVESNWSGLWFARRIRHRRLLPVCQISYRRIARVGTSASGPIRLTIDHDLRVNRIQEIAFSDERGLEVLPPGHALLELKYAFDQPSFFKALIEQFQLQPQSISKYRLSVQALGLVPNPNLSESAPV